MIVTVGCCWLYVRLPRVFEAGVLQFDRPSVGGCMCSQRRRIESAAKLQPSSSQFLLHAIGFNIRMAQHKACTCSTTGYILVVLHVAVACFSRVVALPPLGWEVFRGHARELIHREDDEGQHHHDEGMAGWLSRINFLFGEDGVIDLGGGGAFGEFLRSVTAWRWRKR